ncbi:MAG: hypothetical protein M0C28_22985 [Candidatus Moduliflexus flocculans]|nr:hypothetical protein [Candidatus Moduliflexus flocculans]
MQQIFDKTRLEDAAEAVAAGLRRMGIEKKIRPGARIAITAGSRGIQNLVKMTRAAVDTVKALGGRPFIVPAMGSHGGATDEGQKSLLADLGISEATMGCPVLSSVAGRGDRPHPRGRPGLSGQECPARGRHHRDQPRQAPHHLPRRRGKRPVQDPRRRPRETQGGPADPPDWGGSRSWSRPPG